MKLSPTLSYGLKEVIILVIGVLIALQVNNWNENRKRKNTEIQLLTSLRNDLHTDSLEVHADLLAHISFQRNCQAAVDYMKSGGKSWPDTLNRKCQACFLDRHAFMVESGFQWIEHSGWEAISNSKLLREISDLYYKIYVRMDVYGSILEKHDIVRLLRPYQLKHFEVTDDCPPYKFGRISKEIIPICSLKVKDFDALINDQAFFVDLNRSFDWRVKKITKHQVTLYFIGRVMEEIDKELSK